MLKGIPRVLSPDLFKIMMEMGHGDELVIADGNFPAAGLARRLIRCDGHGVPEILDAILGFYPLDTFVPHPVTLMAVVHGDEYQPSVWEKYRAIMKSHGEAADFEYVERYAFYERTKGAYAVVATSETARYANIIMKKGIV